MPLPPPGLMWTTGAPSVENFLVVGEAWAQVVGHFLRLGSRVLDIGSGCGKLARHLVGHPFVERYVGFDVIAESVAWCRRFIVPHSGGRFRFEHLDVHSTEYNPRGAFRGDAAVFPANDGTITLAAAASLFTHLLEPEARHYLRETARVLAPSGLAVLSIHTQAPPRVPFAGTAARVDVAPDYFVAMTEEAGLTLRERLGPLCGQETFVFER
ncbi:MAG TPA: class I SAM-dependent methyltransferase [Candidatus Binatia bacterium]|nr:class I SAM-dependent methyltransferase [Candidatus Binatia bacterium]